MQSPSTASTAFGAPPLLSRRKDVGTTSVSKESVLGNSRTPSGSSDHHSKHARSSSGSKSLTPSESSHYEQPQAYYSPSQMASTASETATTAASTEPATSLDKDTQETTTKTEGGAPPQRPGYTRQRSTLLFEESGENENDEYEVNTGLGNMSLAEDVQPFSRAGSGEEIDLMGNTATGEPGPKIDQKIVWKEGGSKVYVTGSFTGWRRMIKLNWDSSANEFSTVLKLSLGTHRFRFVVDGEMRCSNSLATATDSMGNLVNYLEVGIEDYTRQYGTDLGDLSLDEEGGGGYERYREEEEAENLRPPKLEYGCEIPPVFCDPEVMDKFAASEFVAPPQLPPHLESVVLNSNSTEKDNNSVLPIPNHVVLNHLATTSIKHNVLAVASISRYSRKYVAQILYAPL